MNSGERETTVIRQPAFLVDEIGNAGRSLNRHPLLGMALFEETIYDQRNGAPINSNLADYITTLHADTPEIDVTFLDYPDTNLNEFGARCIGEIGLAACLPRSHRLCIMPPAFASANCP